MKNKNDLIRHLRDKKSKKEFIVAAGVDSLSHVKCCQNASCDLILLHPTAKITKVENPFLAGYLPFANTNDLMLQTASEIMPIINSKNVLAGLNGSDPFKIDHLLLGKIKNNKCTGIHNYPTMTLVDGTFGMNIDSLNLGIDKEIQLIKNANAEGLFTCAMVAAQKQATAMAKADADIIIFYCGLDEKKNQDHKRNVRQEIRQLRELTASVRKINPGIPLLFFDERMTTIDEIKMTASEVPEIDGYYLMPVTKARASESQLELEIRQLREL